MEDPPSNFCVNAHPSRQCSFDKNPAQYYKNLHGSNLDHYWDILISTKIGLPESF